MFYAVSIARVIFTVKTSLDIFSIGFNLNKFFIHFTGPSGF